MVIEAILHFNFFVLFISVYGKNLRFSVLRNEKLHRAKAIIYD